MPKTVSTSKRAAATAPRPSTTGKSRRNTNASPSHARIRLRILTRSATAMGPGKADLLDAIGETGSISAAARQMGMSYRRAWLLVDTMNSCFVKPLVTKEKGGVEGGGATLTTHGINVLKLYRRLVMSANKDFAGLLRDTNDS